MSQTYILSSASASALSLGLVHGQVDGCVGLELDYGIVALCISVYLGVHLAIGPCALAWAWSLAGAQHGRELGTRLLGAWRLGKEWASFNLFGARLLGLVIGPGLSTGLDLVPIVLTLALDSRLNND